MLMKGMRKWIRAFVFINSGKIDMIEEYGKIDFILIN